MGRDRIGTASSDDGDRWEPFGGLRKQITVAARRDGRLVAAAETWPHANKGDMDLSLASELIRAVRLPLCSYHHPCRLPLGSQSTKKTFFGIYTSLFFLGRSCNF